MSFVASSLRAKLTLAFAAVAVAFLIAVAIGYTKLATVGNDTAAGYQKAVLANAASAAAFNMRVSESQDTSSHRFIKNPDGSNMHEGDVAAFVAALGDLKKVATSSSDNVLLWQMAISSG